MNSLVKACVLISAGALFVACYGCDRPNTLYVVPEFKELGVIEGELAVAEFEIGNFLTKPVTIENMYPSCRCASVELKDNPIPAGTSTTLRVTADLTGIGAGKNEFTVLLTTDSKEFPRKQVAFSAWKPATGPNKRQISLGRFFPNASINMTVPIASISSGHVRIARNKPTSQALGGNEPVAIGPAPTANLTVTASAPAKIGEFAINAWVYESFPEMPSIKEHRVELELIGQVVPRWKVDSEIYAGFLSFEAKPEISIQMTSNFKGLGELVSDVEVNPDQGWLRVASHHIESDKIVLQFELVSDAIENQGPTENELEFIVNYKDGDSEKYSSRVFAFLEM